MCDKDMFNEMEEGDSLGISSLLLMENPPVHLIISRPVEAENKYGLVDCVVLRK